MAVYKKNFLTQVIFRVDFDEVELGQLEAFAKTIKTTFPTIEQKERQEMLMTLDTKIGNVQHSQKKKVFWQIFNVDKTKRVEVDTTFIAITYSEYKDSKVLLKDIGEVFDTFVKKFDVKTIKRIGLRYVNEITLPKDKDVLDLGKYISKSLISNLDLVKDSGMKTSRTINQIMLRNDDVYITFNSGMVNKDYPNEIVNKEFLLDYDCVSKFPIDVNNISLVDIAKKYNKYIEGLFELSIEQGLRNILKK